MKKHEINNEDAGAHIINFDKFNQPVLFDKLGIGQMRMTDFDGVMEVDNKFLILSEVKQAGKEMPYGQSLSYERVCKAWVQSGKKGVVILAYHNELDPTKPIFLKDCIVTKIYTNGKWKSIKPIKYRDLYLRILKHWKVQKFYSLWKDI